MNTLPHYEMTIPSAQQEQTVESGRGCNQATETTREKAHSKGKSIPHKPKRLREKELQRVNVAKEEHQAKDQQGETSGHQHAQRQSSS